MMPMLALVGMPGPRWLPPIPVPLFLLWPFVPFCLAIARLLERDRPNEAATLQAVTHVFLELRGLEIDVDAVNQKPVRIRFI